MNFVQIQPNEIHLKGISRTNTFYINNKNPFLAVAFELSFSNQLSSSNPRLSLFPQKGVLLRGESQPVKVKFTNGGLDSTFDSFSQMISVKLSLKIQYNRQLMIREKLRSWDQVPSQIQERQVEVIVGREKEAIENYIKEDIIFNQEFDQSQLNISAIQQSKNNNFLNDNSFDDLKLESIIKDQLLSSQSGQIDINNINIHSPVRQAPVQDLYPLQYGQSKANWFQKSVSNEVSNEGEMKLQFVQSRLTNSQNKSFIEMKTVQNNEFSDDFNYSSKQSHAKTLELVILAIVAAFFVSLGNNLGRIIGTS